LKRAGTLRTKYLTLLSNPPQDRRIYQAIARTAPQAILEIGIGSGERASRMLELALRYQEPDQLRYIGIDLFEARPPENPGLTLKRAHRSLSEWGASIRLVPGDPAQALTCTANGLGPVDLVVISGDQNISFDSRVWFYLPRLLAKDALVFEEKQASMSGRGEFQQHPLAELHSRADALARRFRRAA
jgi:hypothetical protein